MLLVYLIQWIVLVNSHISAQNITSGESANRKLNLVRRQWPEIKFEDLDIMSGDGPNSDLLDNITETYVWTTIITQIKATVWPTVTRRQVLTPKPKPIRVSSTPIISCHKFWSQISYLPTEPNSEDLLESILRRSSMEYPGPSSTIALSLSSDISMSSVSSFGSQLISISESMQSYFGSESVSPSDRLTQHFSQHFSTKDYILSPSLEINSNSYSIPSIESSFAFSSDSPTEPTPIHWLSSTIESDKNSISSSLLSFSISNGVDIVSSDKPFITSIDSSLRLISVPTTPTPQPKGVMNNTIDSSQSTPVKTKPESTANPAIKCPEALQNQTPSVSLKKPFEDYLVRTVNDAQGPTIETSRIGNDYFFNPGLNSDQYQEPKKNVDEVVETVPIARREMNLYLMVGLNILSQWTVLNNTSNESMDSIRTRIERNIKEIYIFALKRQHNITDQMAGSARKLLSEVNYTNIEVKIRDVITSKDSDQIDVIYYVERDGDLIPYEDLAKTLSYIGDDKYQEMIGLTVIEKVKPYNEVKWAESAINWWSIILSLILAIIIIMCIPLMACLWWKSRTERRKLIDAFNSQLNRVVPDNQIHWRTVSKPMDANSAGSVSTNDRPKAVDNRNEFQYLRFESDVKQKETKPKSKASKSTQIETSLEMQKQKVIPIGELIDESTDSSGRSGRSAPNNEYIKTHFVTTKEIETKTDTNDCIPRLMSVQMSAQTESIIRAIRSELNRIGHNSNAIPFIDDSQPEESIISNTSEA